MAKVESKFIYNGDEFSLEFETKAIKIFVSDNDSVALVCDNENNVLFEIGCDCSQNTAFLTTQVIK